jgi:rod shape determining protein RodA
MWIVANIPPQPSRARVPSMPGAVALVGVALFGVTVNGSRRWLNLGFGRFQPSELMKVAVPLLLAWYFQKFEGRIGWRDFTLAAALIAVPVYLIKRQPDLGTALLIGASGVLRSFWPGCRGRSSSVSRWRRCRAPLVWQHLHRLPARADPHLPRPTGAIPWAPGITRRRRRSRGSGGVSGTGWLNGTQTSRFLPERHTDFIFAVFGGNSG